MMAAGCALGFWELTIERNGRGDILKVDGFLARSLFDLYSNFTFFLKDPVNGDGIQQHDSRLQEGANVQYLHPHKLFGQRALFVAGSNFHDNQINVGLYPRVKRNPIGVTTRAHAHVTNQAEYVQQGIDFWQGRLHLDGGLRYDYFRFNVEDKIDPLTDGTQGASRLQPKANLAFTPLNRDFSCELRPRHFQPGCSRSCTETLGATNLNDRLLPDGNLS
jgi:outer membrane receptor protein involved in Fe transport